MHYYLSRETADKVVSAFARNTNELRVVTTSAHSSRLGRMSAHIFSLNNILTPELEDLDIKHINVRVGLTYTCELIETANGSSSFCVSDISLSHSEPLVLIGFGKLGARTLRSSAQQSFDMAMSILSAVEAAEGRYALCNALIDATSNLVDRYDSLLESIC